jgi:pimeloyl-ACP methyl ester carboxylesterase/DNA-binding CsgD family transcriptional regulator
MTSVVWRTMDTPLIRYATTGDGVKIAYWAVGKGPPFVVLPALPHSHIGIEWEQQEYRRTYELGASTMTIVRYDGRGLGLSQRDVEDFSMEAMLADLDAVIGELGPGPVALEGVINSAPIAVAYAARHPERVSHLLLWCPVIDCSVHLDNPRLQAARQIMATDWETFTLTVAHSLIGWSEPEAARRFAELVRAGITQETALAFVPAMHRFDARAELADIQCPTLVMHRPELSLLPPGSVEEVAAAIPDARLALFEGASSAPFVGDWRAVVRAEAEFFGVSFEPDRAPASRRALRLLSMKSETLTPRELGVVELIAGGLTNREIAGELHLAEKTVEHHVGRILVKLDLRSRTEVAAYALRRGLADRSA